MEINVTDEAMKKALSEAIMVSLGEEIRDKLIKDALEHLLAKQVVKEQYGRSSEGPSKVEELFGQYVEGIARDTIRDLVTKDEEVLEAINKFVKGAVIRLMTDEDNGLATAMSAAMAKSLMGARY